MSQKALHHDKCYEMPTQVLQQLIKKAMSHSYPVVSFCWQGGEPTLLGVDFFRQILELQASYAPYGTIIQNSVQTNGILISEEWARLFKKYNFLVGLSLDGVKEFHNFYRIFRNGQGTFEQVIRAARILSHYDVDYNILTTLTDKNTLYPKRLYHFFRNQGFKYLQFIPCVEFDKKGQPMSFSVDPELYGRFLIKMFALWLTNGKQDKIEGLEDIEKPYISIRMFEEFAKYFVYGYVNYCVFKEKCGDYLVVNYNGDVFPCDFLVKEYWRLGNILEEEVSSLLEKEKFKEFMSLKKEKSTDCISCRWLRICNGGCPLHYIQNSNKKKNYLCLAYKRFFEETEDIFQSTALVLKAHTKTRRVCDG